MTIEALLGFLIPLSPVLINIGCIKAKKGKILSLIVSLCGVLPSLLIMMLNNGYGIGFGNPWIGVDWGLTVIYLLYLSALLVTHAYVPSSGKIKTVSVIFIVLTAACTVFLTGIQIANTLGL